ncbi:hypothetical protein NLG97_g4328 [Lecanicillium saksenae]|uniref:Uncharacterized protein n=1 Tax=Lecanicillium saksenae TaxID=468837 RepID=A0ACC1QWT0_9HYPO|nr:hypothetical protein NLG97_g4328 [Lecanicillium saksenae]
MALDLVQIYLVTLSGAVGIPILLFAARSSGGYVTPYLRRQCASMIHSTLTFWPRTSYLQTALILLYIGVNAAVLSFHTKSESTRDGTLSKRASLLASANMMLLFLGGRTNPSVDFVQIPLFVHRFAHRWIAVVATGEALLHAVLELSQRPRLRPVALSGCVSAGSLLLTGLIALWPGRRLGRLYGKAHLLVYLAVLAGLLWHVLLQTSKTAKILAFVCCGLWAGAHIFRLVRMFLLGHAYAEVIQVQENAHAVQVTVKTARPLGFFPGCYYYVFFKGPLPFYDLFHGYPMMPFWASSEYVTTGAASEFNFLASQTGAHERALRTLRKGQFLRLDGPYGRDLRLQSYETVVLAAKGMGIVGVLPFARHLAERRNHDDGARNESARLRDSREPVFGDLSRNVDLIWWLENKQQEDWVAEQLKQLQKLDTKNLLVVWCVYPSSRGKKPPYRVNDYWKARHDFDTASFARELRQETRYPGENVLLACGEVAFMSEMRTLALENTTPDRFIRFLEVEFRPSPTGNTTKGIQSALQPSFNEDVELQRVPSSYSRGSWDSQVTLVEQVKTQRPKQGKKRKI